jgi:hypothetical protein
MPLPAFEFKGIQSGCAMQFQVTCHLQYDVEIPSTLIMSLHAQRNESQSVLSEHFAVEPRIKVEEFMAEGTANRFIRLQTGRRKQLTIDYEATVDCEHQVIPARKINYRVATVSPIA